MNRQQKEAVVADFKEMFSQAQAVFLVNYCGLNVHDMISLRRMLRKNSGKLKVTKARLMKIAVEEVDGGDLFKQNFRDQIGLVFAMEEVAPVAKALVEFAKAHEALKIVSGFSESMVLSRSEVEFYASLPSREVVFGQFAWALQRPISGLARVLNATIQNLAYVLDAVAKKKTQVG